MIAQKRDVVVMGGSAGSLEGLHLALRGLRGDFPGMIFVVIHMPAHGTTNLDELIRRWTILPAAFAQSDQTVRPGQIYIAPADRHLIIGRDHVHPVTRA